MNELDYNLFIHFNALCQLSQHVKFLQNKMSIQIIKTILDNIEQLQNNGANIPAEMSECISLSGFEELKELWNSIIEVAHQEKFLT